MEHYSGPRHLFFTGTPGCGKSTLILKIVRRLETPCTGFLTREIREKGKRAGFLVQTLSGQKEVLAHRAFSGPPRVGAYGVDIEAFEKIAVPSMRPEGEDPVVVIDEVGKMECLSTMFRKALLRALDSEDRLLGTIAAKGNAFIEGIKKRKDVTLIRVTEKNRDMLVQKALDFLYNARE